MFDPGRVAGFLGEHLFTEELQGIYARLKELYIFISIHFGFCHFYMQYIL